MKNLGGVRFLPKIIKLLNSNTGSCSDIKFYKQVYKILYKLQLLSKFYKECSNVTYFIIIVFHHKCIKKLNKI